MKFNNEEFRIVLIEWCILIINQNAQYKEDDENKEEEKEKRQGKKRDKGKKRNGIKEFFNYFHQTVVGAKLNLKVKFSLATTLFQEYIYILYTLLFFFFLFASITSHSPIIVILI